MAIVAPARHSSPFHGFSHLDERRGSTSTQSSTQESSASHAPYNPRRASKLSEISSNSDKDTQTSCATYGFFSSVHSDVPLLTIQQVGKDTTGWNKGKSLAGDGAAEDLSGSSGGDDSPPLPIKEYALGRNSGSFRREPRDEAINIRRLSLVSLHSIHSSTSFRSSIPSPKRKSSSLYSNPLAPLQRRLLRSLEHRDNSVKSERAEQVHEILIELLEAVTSFLKDVESGRDARGWILELRSLVEELIEINVEWKKAFDSGLYGPLSFVTSSKRLEENDLYDTGYDWWPRRLRRDCRCVLSWSRDETRPALSSRIDSIESLLGSNSSGEESSTMSKKGEQCSEERRIQLLLIGQQRWARFRAANAEVM